MHALTNGSARQAVSDSCLMASPRFVYFDLGKVLVDFDVARMYRQMCDVSGADEASVRELLCDDHAQRRYELGQIDGREFHEAFCEKTGTRPDYHALRTASCDIFSLNMRIVPLVAHLAQAGVPLGILSNTCVSHWEYCRRRFRIVAEAFGTHAMSFEVGAVKPDAVIYRAAAEAAGAAPEEIFFIDDLPDNVAGARAAGFDAVQYTTVAKLAAELHVRAVRLNY